MLSACAFQAYQVFSAHPFGGPNLASLEQYLGMDPEISCISQVFISQESKMRNIWALHKKCVTLKMKRKGCRI